MFSFHELFDRLAVPPQNYIKELGCYYRILFRRLLRREPPFLTMEEYLYERSLFEMEKKKNDKQN